MRAGPRNQCVSFPVLACFLAGRRTYDCHSGVDNAVAITKVTALWGAFFHSFLAWEEEQGRGFGPMLISLSFFLSPSCSRCGVVDK